MGLVISHCLDHCAQHHCAFAGSAFDPGHMDRGVRPAGCGSRQLGRPLVHQNPHDYVGYAVMFVANWIFYCTVLQGIVSIKQSLSK